MNPSRPTAAKGGFPYFYHRTVAQVDREAAEKANRHAILNSLARG
jgi:hypothetical protein